MHLAGRGARQIVFPTLEFPSDHALVSAVFTARTPPPIGPGAAAAAESAAGPEGAASAGGRGAPPPPPLAPASVSSSVSSEGALGRKGASSLYEYWGIADSASAMASVIGNRGGSQASRSGNLSTLAAAAAADDDSDADADATTPVHCSGGGDAAAARAAVAARAVEAWFVRAGRRAAGGRDLDDWREELSRMSDRSIWIVFRPVAATNPLRLLLFTHPHTLRNKSQ